MKYYLFTMFLMLAVSSVQSEDLHPPVPDYSINDNVTTTLSNVTLVENEFTKFYESTLPSDLYYKHCYYRNGDLECAVNDEEDKIIYIAVPKLTELLYKKTFTKK